MATCSSSPPAKRRSDLFPVRFLIYARLEGTFGICRGTTPESAITDEFPALQKPVPKNVWLSGLR
jgi:hypothetical protein